MKMEFLGLSLFSHCPTLLLIGSKFSNLPLIMFFPVAVIDLPVFISAHEFLHLLFLSSH